LSTGAFAEPADDTLVINEDIGHRDPFTPPGGSCRNAVDRGHVGLAVSASETARCKQMI